MEGVGGWGAGCGLDGRLGVEMALGLDVVVRARGMFLGLECIRGY